MKKIVFLLFIPFFFHAQNPVEDKSKPTEKITVDSVLSPKQEALKRIEGYRQRVIKGENMSTLASQFSDDPGSSKQGGIYQNVEKGVFVAEFETIAFNLKPGEISEIFETEFGFHFIQLIARNGDKIDLRHILVKVN